VSFTRIDDYAANSIGYPQVIAKDSGTAKAAGQTHTPWYQTGVIGAGAAPTGALNGATFTGPGVAGSIPMPAAVASQTVKLTRLALNQGGSIGHLWIVDRIWGNVPVVTTTTSQAITSPTWPARDATASTNGAKVYLALECSSATGNGAPITNTTVSYTNSAGTAGRTATLSSFPATAVAGTWQLFALTAGDDGVRSVQSVTLGTSYVSGQVHLIAFRPIAELATPTANVGAKAGFQDLAMPTVWDNSVLQLVYFPTGTALGALAGSCSYAQG
jgi:hypothetical protein